MLCRHWFIALALSAFTVFGCAADTSSQASFATDSWKRPTHHGPLSFDNGNQAEFTAATRFHGWDFTIHSQADVVLAVSSADTNLDTVAYLYRADDEGRKTGTYLFKNDNHAGMPASRIAESLSAGRYFLQVKAANVVMRGPFQVNATCSGSGCPAVSNSQEFCDSAHEAIAKCLDDSLDATEESCAPDANASEAVLCCNLAPGESFCEDVCSSYEAVLARYWGSSTKPIADVFPQGEDNELVGIADYAVANCLKPSVDDLASLILAVAQQEDDADWDVVGWIHADAPGFVDGSITQEVIARATQIVGEAPASRFAATVQLPCANCSDGHAIDALYFTKTGRILTIESR